MSSKVSEKEKAKSEKDKEREFKNPYDDYDGQLEIYITDEKKLIPGIEGPLKENVYILLKTLETHLQTDVDWQDNSVYTGTAGIAMLYLRFLDSGLVHEDPAKGFLECGLSFVEPVLSTLRRRKSSSFLCGAGGVLAVCATLLHRKGETKAAHDLQRRIQNMAKDVCAFQNDCPNELLYGRAGYLQALLFCRKNITQDEDQTVFLGRAIREVVHAILDSGQRMCNKHKNASTVPLYYHWHEKPYVGAGHGYAGILLMLLEAREFISEAQMSELVQPTIEFVLKQQLQSGNFSSSLGNPRDRLVHWCHGAPGVIHLLLRAYEILGEDCYLEGARSCAECVWKRGLLRKGYGICHGVSGNGYAFIRMYQVTREVKYLYRAVKYAEWCFDYGKHGCRTPDRSLSLFEGFAGIVYFLLDLLFPEEAAFPGFKLS